MSLTRLTLAALCAAASLPVFASAPRQGLVEVSIQVTGQYRGTPSGSGEVLNVDYQRSFSYRQPLLVIPSAGSGIAQIDKRETGGEQAADLQQLTGLDQGDAASIEAIAAACGDDDACMMSRMLAVAQGLQGKVQVDQGAAPRGGLPNFERYLVLASDGGRCGAARLQFDDHHTGSYVEPYGGVRPFDFHERMLRDYPADDAELMASGMCAFSGAIDTERRRYHLLIPVSRIRATTTRSAHGEHPAERMLVGYADEQTVFLDLPLPGGDSDVVQGERRVANIADGLDALISWKIRLQ
jgi:hypothetical protein